MLDLALTSDQEQLVATVRDFCAREFAPTIQADDRAGRHDPEIFAKLASIGLPGVCFPQRYGGVGLDYLSLGLVCEELEYVDTVFRTVLSVHVGLVGMGLYTWDFMLVFAKTDPKAGGRGVTAFMLDRSTSGKALRTEPIEGRLGLHAGDVGSIFMTDLEVPEANRIGDEGDGFKIAMSCLDNGRYTVAAGATGTVRASLDASVKYARERKTFGQEIGRYQLVQQMIARMSRDYEICRLLYFKVAWMKNTGARHTRDVSIAKQYATDAAFNAAHDAVEVHGAYGYSAEYPVERFLRNARAPIIYEGTREVHTILQGEYALGYREDRPVKASLPPYRPD